MFHKVVIAFCAVVAGTTIRRIALLLIATTTRPRIVTITLGFGWVYFLRSSKKSWMALIEQKHILPFTKRRSI
jgi:hypothetical protein